MLFKKQLAVTYILVTVATNLLPFNFETTLSVLANSSHGSQSQAEIGKVNNRDIAVTTINDFDGVTLQSGAVLDRSKHSIAAGFPTDNIDGVFAGYRAPSPIRAAVSVVAHALYPRSTGGKVNDSDIAVTQVNNADGIQIDKYIKYRGNGSTKAGWPDKSAWISFTDMFNSSRWFMERSCKQFDVKLNSADEIEHIYSSIQSVANATFVDHRFILAVIMQESGGCVRAPTSNFGVPNPGLMQDHNGTASCNDGELLEPCPKEVIQKMIQHGTGGTPWGDGLAQCLNRAAKNGNSDVSAFYKATRMYNSGSIDPSGDLGRGVATHCYASDIANRLTGWVKSDRHCDLDDSRVLADLKIEIPGE